MNNEEVKGAFHFSFFTLHSPLLFLLAGVFALAISNVWADNNWTGAASDNLFKTDGNWSTGSCPTSDKINLDSNNFDASFTANEIVFDEAYVNNGNFVIQNVGTSEESPFVLRATAPSYGLTCGSASTGSYIGYSNGRAYLMISNGTWNTGSVAKNMTVGSYNKSWLKLKDVQSFTVNQLYMHNGSTIVLEDSTLATSQVLKDNLASVNTLRVDGGTLKATRDEASAFIQSASYLKLAVGEKGGTIDNGGYNITMGKLLGDVDGTGPLHLTGAGTTTLGNTLIKNGTIVVDGGTVIASALHIGESSGNDGHVEVNGGTLSIPKNVHMCYGPNSTATLTINGGTVEVDPDKTLRSADASGSSGTINLNGGVLKTQRIAQQYGSCTINFNGGTLQANAANTDFIKSGIAVNVGQYGGTIDNGGHNLTINASNIDGTGGLAFRGGGTNTFGSTPAFKSTYAGVTSVTPGTTLVIYRNDAKQVLNNGLALVGVPELNKPYTLMTAANESDWASFDVSNVTCPVAEEFTVELVKRAESDMYINTIVVTVTSLKSGNVWTGAKDSNMSDPDNWLAGIVPADGADIDLSAATTVNAENRTFGAVTMGSGVVTFTGSLTATSFSDTSKVAVGANSTVTIAGDLSFNLSSNRNICYWVGDGGRFEVTGDIKVTAGTRYLNPCVASVGTGVIAAKGLVNNAGSDYCFRLVRAIAGYRANWKIGENGLSGEKPFAVSRDADATAKIIAATDFTIATGVMANKALELDTAGHTVKIKSNYEGTGAKLFSGAGTVEVASGVGLGTGDITLEAGTTLALTATGSAFTQLENTLNLPMEGVVKLRIDGTGLRSGDHVIATLGAGTADNVELEPENPGTALDGRKATFSVDSDNNLILNIKPNGLMMIVR